MQTQRQYALAAPTARSSRAQRARQRRETQREQKARTVLWLTVTALIAALAWAWLLSASDAFAQSVRPPADAVQSSTPPASGDEAYQTAPELGGNYDAQLWSKIRQQAAGTVSIPDQKAGILVDSSGEVWRNFREGPLLDYGAYALLGVIALLAVYYLIRGRITIESGRAGWTIERFTDVERMGHWLLAVSFIILALTGLNLMYGRDILMPLIGKEAFATISQGGKWLHNYVGFAFMLGILLTFVMWIRHNIPDATDAKWIAQGGGLIGHGHPPAKKFNAGQKVLFWLVILGGFSISLSGLQLLFPFELPMFAKTFEVLNTFGFNLPTELTVNQEQQLATSWHAIMALILTAVVIAHIYIGTIGMEGAFDAMGSGHVDANWAKEHHSIWAEEKIEEERIIPRGEQATGGGARPQPAE